MSFLSFNKPNIEVGDTVIIYLNVKTLHIQVVEAKKVFQTKFGAIKHDNLIGSPYGSKYQCSKGYVYILRATPELWTLALPHRTQILYFHDISLITANLELKPGSVIVEAGTGSGSLTHSLARTVAPTGHVHTFDFHENRVIEARQEFKDHGLGEIVSSNQRDVCNDGFPEELTSIADALFLDLPHPWEAINSAKKVLKSQGGRICCFSPCIEQVQKTCIALSQERFIDISTIECVQKPYEVRHFDMLTVETSKKEWVVRGGSNKNSGDVQLTDDIKMEMIDDEINSALETPVSSSDLIQKKPPNYKTYVAANPIVPVVGHTGFLTFATTFSF